MVELLLTLWSDMTIAVACAEVMDVMWKNDEVFVQIMCKRAARCLRLKINPHHQAMWRVVLKCDGGVVGVAHPFHNGESESAACFAGVDAGEAFKHALALPFGYACACVGNGEDDGVMCLVLGEGNGYVAMFWAIADGIVEEVT
jgi:hypothetical protein